MPKQHVPFVLGLIPARGGSKGIPNKNIRPLAGKPLILYTCQAALGSHRLERTILSTDSYNIAQAARATGVEIPFFRPAELAADDTPMRDVIRHTLQWLGEHTPSSPDIIVLLQPTAPLRSSSHIDQAVALLLSADVDSVVSVSPVPEHYSPHWQFTVEGGRLRPFLGESLENLVPRRQELPTTHFRNGAIYAFRRRSFERFGTLYGRRCAAYIMPSELSVNIDTEDDWKMAEAALHAQSISRAAA